ncbi:hypothetical protein Barb6_03064 [Bacteroidales bacterium Barb6]|nr:hypothetical protein Barb6_03064 [Bacteroidales bacterium Barb6]
MRLDSHVALHGKRVGIAGRKALTRCICPLHKMILRMRDSLQRYLCVVSIYAAALLYPAVVIGRQAHEISIQGKMRPDIRVAFRNKRVGIIIGKAVAGCVCPLHKMIPRIRDSLRLHLCIVSIYAVVLLYRTVFFGRQTHTIIACNKIRLDIRVAFHNKRVGIIGGKALTRCICPFYKLMIFKRVSRQCQLRAIGDLFISAVSGYPSFYRII